MKNSTMGTKQLTLGRLTGLVCVVAALVSGTASASTSGSTPQGLKADGLRLQGIAQVYERMRGRPAASFYTPQALKAEGLRWQAIGQVYAGHRTAMVSASSSRSGFNWGDAGIGAASSLGFAACAVALVLLARRFRRELIAHL